MGQHEYIYCNNLIFYITLINVVLFFIFCVTLVLYNNTLLQCLTLSVAAYFMSSSPGSCWFIWFEHYVMVI